MRLIDGDALYEKTAEWEAMALHMVENPMNDEDTTEWKRWSTILTERSAFKFDVADAPTVDAVPVVRCKDCKHRPAKPEKYGIDPDRLTDIIDAEKEGRLLVLPCKVGSKIYILRGDVRNGYETVKETHVEEVPFGLGCLDKQMKLYPFYYLTREEAEAKLKECGNE